MNTVETIINGEVHVKEIGEKTCATTIRIPKILVQKVEHIRKELKERDVATKINTTEKLNADFRSRNSFMQFIIEAFVFDYEKIYGGINVTENH